MGIVHTLQSLLIQPKVIDQRLKEFNTLNIFWKLFPGCWICSNIDLFDCLFYIAGQQQKLQCPVEQELIGDEMTARLLTLIKTEGANIFDATKTTIIHRAIFMRNPNGVLEGILIVLHVVT